MNGETKRCVFGRLGGERRRRQGKKERRQSITTAASASEVSRSRQRRKTSRRSFRKSRSSHATHKSVASSKIAHVKNSSHFRSGGTSCFRSCAGSVPFARLDPSISCSFLIRASDLAPSRSSQSIPAVTRRPLRSQVISLRC